MKKTSFSFLISSVICIYSIVVATALFFASCSSTRVVQVEDNNESDNSQSQKTEEQTPPEENWRGISDISEIYGTWISEEGQKYQIPIRLNNKQYLLYCGKESDDTELWKACAKRHFTSIENLWLKRFAYIAEIYGGDYPCADINGTEVGYKLFLKKNEFGQIEKIISRFDRLIPMKIAERNLNFFFISNSGKLKEIGTFYMYSDKFRNAYADSFIFSKYEDYWRD